MKDLHPNFIPLWTKVVETHFKENQFGFSARRHVVDEKKLDWFLFDRCFLGEALLFDKKESMAFWDQSERNHKLATYSGGVFKTLNQFYQYKARLYKAIEKFKEQ